MSNLVPAFRDSIFSPLGDPAGEILEVGIDMVFENDALKSIPIVNTVVGLCKVGVNLHERNLLRQTGIFINEVRDGTISSEKLEQHRAELERDPEKAEKELGRVLIILGRQVDDFQSKVLGSFYRAFVRGAISWEKFCELAEANSRMFSGDYMVLEEAYYGDLKNNKRELYQIDRLTSLGLLENQQRTGVAEDDRLSFQGGTLTINNTSDKNVSLTSFGTTFCQLMPKSRIVSA